MVVTSSGIALQKKVCNKLRRLNPNKTVVIIVPSVKRQMQTLRIPPSGHTLAFRGTKSQILDDGSKAHEIAQSSGDGGDADDFQYRPVA